MLVPDLLRHQASTNPQRLAVVIDGHGEMSYAAWETRSNRLARHLVAAGISPGDRVAIRLPNDRGIAYLVAYMATHKAGAVAVPLNTQLVGAEVQHILAHCEAVALLGLGIPNLPASVLHLGPEDLDPAGEDSTFQVPRQGSDLADVLYTSGTTGFPKGVACSHESITYKASSQLHTLFDGATLLHALPLFTFAGTHAMTLIAIRGGMTQLVQPAFDAHRFLELITENRVSLAYAVPAMVLRCLDQPRIQDGGFESLRLLMYGTAPMPPAGIRGLAKHFSQTFLINLYGLTEGGAAVCSLPPQEALARPESIGKPLPPTEVRIVTETGEMAPEGESGEIQLRAPAPSRSYFHDDAATADTWTEDGWLRTGDVGRLDADGYLYLVDRIKDLIIVGGHNISAPEVEGVLMEHPGVQDVAVVALPHPKMGEVPRACVVIRPGASATPEELQAFAEDRLASYKVPRRYDFMAELPRNALGKVLKRELRERL